MHKYDTNIHTLVRSEMAVHRRKMYVSGLWESFYALGRTVPLLATLSVMSLGYKGHVTARVMYMLVQYMFFVEDMFCFYVQMSINSVGEAAVTFRRNQVGSKIKGKAL